MEKIVLVTGASRGIGRAIVKELAEGNIVIANYNKSKEKAESLKQELENKGQKIEIYKADVSKREEVSEMVNYIINKYGRIDVLINNAGIDLVKLFTDVTDEDWNYVINNNLYSVFCVSQEVAKNMVHEKKRCYYKYIFHFWNSRSLLRKYLCGFKSWNRCTYKISCKRA